ncbi:hypothetical protein EON65_59210, partial [archaeon]
MTSNPQKGSREGKRVMSNVYSVIRVVLVGVGLLASLICSYFVCLSVFRALSPSSASVGKIKLSPQKTVNSIDLNNGLNWRPSKHSSLPFSNSAPLLKDWGTFRPGYYFGLKSKTPKRPWATGILWSDSSRMRYRHTTEQDEISKFEWIRHDGESFGTQELVDKQYRLSMETSFVVPDKDTVLHLGNKLASSKAPSWLQKITVKALDNNMLADLPFIWYMGLDTGGDRTDPAIVDNTLSNLKVIQDPSRIHVLGHTAHLGYFCLTVQVMGVGG